MKKYKPEANKFLEGEGYYMLHCRTKEIAYKALLEELPEQGDENLVIDPEKIIETRYFWCDDCGMNWIKDPCGCIEGKNLKGRKCYAYLFYS